MPSVFRKASDITEKVTNGNGEEETRILGMKVRRQVDPTATIPTGMNTAAKSGDLIGWIAIDVNPQPTSAIHNPQSDLQSTGAATRIYTSDGRMVTSKGNLRPGLYILTDGHRSRKMIVK